MADKKLTDLVEDTAPTANDLLLTTDIETGQSKKVKFSNVNGAINSLTASDGSAVSTASTTYVALTGNPAVTATIGPRGMALVTVSSLHYNSTAGQDVYHSFAVSGATTQAATDARATSSNGTAGVTSSTTTLVTGLTAGSNTFTSQYRASGSTGNYLNKSISVVPL